MIRESSHDIKLFTITKDLSAELQHLDITIPLIKASEDALKISIPNNHLEETKKSAHNAFCPAHTDYQPHSREKEKRFLIKHADELVS